MDLTPEDFHSIRRASTLEGAQQRLAIVKEKVKVGFRKLVLQLHPDHTNGDPEKTELFKLLIALKEDLDKLQVERRSPPQVPPMPIGVTRVVVRYYPSGGQTSTVNIPRPRASTHQQAVAAATMHPGGVTPTRVR